LELRTGEEEQERLQKVRMLELRTGEVRMLDCNAIVMELRTGEERLQQVRMLELRLQRVRMLKLRTGEVRMLDCNAIEMDLRTGEEEQERLQKVRMLELRTGEEEQERLQLSGETIHFQRASFQPVASPAADIVIVQLSGETAHFQPSWARQAADTGTELQTLDCGVMEHFVEHGLSIPVRILLHRKRYLLHRKYYRKIEYVYSLLLRSRSGRGPGFNSRSGPHVYFFSGKKL